MTRVTLIREINDILQRDYGVDRSIEDPITVRDLAITLQAPKQGKRCY